MDVIHLERPFNDSELNGELWASADEEQLPLALRERLAGQGFRVAVLGGALPTILKTLFNEEEIGQMNGEHLQIQHAIPTLVQTGGPHPVWPKESDDVGGTSTPGPNPPAPTDPQTNDKDAPNGYVNATGMLRVTPRITTTGAIDLVTIPEIQHGDPRKLFIPSLGSNGPLDWSMQIGRQSRLLEDLNFTLRLRPAQYAMISCYTADRNSLGARFFSRQKDGQTMQRVVLIQVEPSQEALAARSHP